jgi:hypothetical protein
MKTYTVIQKRDGNNVWDCGHKHRTLWGAVKCWRTLDGFTRSIGAWIYDNDGEPVSEHDVFGCEYDHDPRNA